MINGDLIQSNKYSTSETDTGKKWIDGKKIYRKVIYAAGHPETIAHGINNLKNVINYYGFMHRNESVIVSQSVPHSDTNTNFVVDINYFGAESIYMIYGSSIVSNITDLVLTIEYTKMS